MVGTEEVDTEGETGEKKRGTCARVENPFTPLCRRRRGGPH